MCRVEIADRHPMLEYSWPLHRPALVEGHILSPTMPGAHVCFFLHHTTGVQGQLLSSLPAEHRIFGSSAVDDL